MRRRVSGWEFRTTSRTRTARPKRIASAASEVLRLRPALLLLAVALTVGACARRVDPPLPRDDSGRAVRLSGAPRRVVTLAPNLTEIVAAIGGEDRIVGADDFSDFPPAMAGLPRVGGATPSVERIAALSPDLVIGASAGSHPALAGALESLGIPLFLIHTERIADVARAMRTLGALLETEGAEEAASNFERALQAQRRNRSPAPRILFMVWPDPLYVAGHQTHADDLLLLVGGTTALPAHVRGWPQLSIEPLIEASPDIILYPRRSVPRDHLERLFARDRRWSAVSAVAEGKVIGVDEDVFSRQGPRLPLAAAELNAILDGLEAER